MQIIEEGCTAKGGLARHVCSGDGARRRRRAILNPAPLAGDCWRLLPGSVPDASLAIVETDPCPVPQGDVMFLSDNMPLAVLAQTAASV